MCVTFLSSGNDVECLKARSTLQLLIEERPDNTVEINKIIKLIYRSQDMKSSDKLEADDDSDAEDIDENFIIQSSDILENKKTLRDSSPFTAHFKEISNSFVDSSRNSDTNPLYNIAYIDFLLLNFMPYTGIWCSIGLRDTTLSRLSNGIIEKLWQYKKGKNNYSQYPANYINSS